MSIIVWAHARGRRYPAMHNSSLKMIGAVLFVIVAFAILFGSIHTTDVDANLLPMIPATRQAAPDFTVRDAHTGKVVRMDDITGKTPIVMSFWATWCGPCRQELPELQKMSQRYAGRVAFYAISSDDPPKKAARFADKMGYTFPILSDTTHLMAEHYGASDLPHLIIIDRGRYVRAVSSGYGPDMPRLLGNTLDTILSGA
jgi:peroxiredoxin